MKYNHRDVGTFLKDPARDKQFFRRQFMDTFMDQLSQKLNAQQIIRANGEAESEAMGVMRAQVREYQDCLDRMKNVADELGGLQQTIAALPDLSGGIGIDDKALDDLKAQMENMNRVNEEYLQKMQGDLLASQNDFISRQQDLAQSQNDLMTRQSEMFESRSNELKEQIESIKVSNEEHLERLRSDIEGSGNGGDELANRFDNLALQIEAKIEEIKVYYNEQLERVRMEIAESKNDELAAKIDTLESSIGTKFGDMQQGVDLQMSAVKSSNEELINKMEGALSKDSGNEQVVELVEVLRDEVSAMKIQMENMRSGNDQYLQTMQSNLRRGQEQMIQNQNALSQTLGNADIHKECVRVYRNVQASVQDENAKQLESIKQENVTQLESIKHEGSRNLTAIREESAKLLGSLRNDNSKQVESIREENAKVLVGIKTETSRLEEEVKNVKKIAVFAVIVSVLAVAAPFVAAFLF